MRIRTIWEMGLRMRDRRLALGWSQAELADRLGTTRQWVNSLEHGNPGATLGQVLQAIEVLGLRMDVRDRPPRGAGSPGGRRELSDDEMLSYLDEVLDRAPEPEDPERDPQPDGRGTDAPAPPLDDPAPRKPPRRRKKE
jgi:transcriptional regulator with XRE-family HTH domain